MPTNAEIANRLVEESGITAPLSVAKNTESGSPRSLADQRLDKLPPELLNILAFMEGVGSGVPMSGPAKELGTYLGEKITGDKAPEPFSKRSPISHAIGTGIGMLPGFVAGNKGLALSKLPFLGKEGAFPAIVRSGLSNVNASEMQDPHLDPKRAGIDLAFGAGGEAGTQMSKALAKWLFGSVLKRPTTEISQELLNNEIPVEQTLFDRASKIPRTWSELKEWFALRGLKGTAKQAQKEGQALMPERAAIIARAEAPDPKTVVKPLYDEMYKYQPHWIAGAKPIPGTEMPVGKMKKAISDTLEWLKTTGSAKDVEALKETNSSIAYNLYGKGPLPPTQTVGKQIAKKTARGAREALEEAAGPEGPRLAALNKAYGESKDIATATANAAARKGKGIGLVPATLAAAGLGAGALGETKPGSDVGAGEASIPLLVLAALSSPTGRMMAANILAKSTPAFKALGPFLSGSARSVVSGGTNDR